MRAAAGPAAAGAYTGVGAASLGAARDAAGAVKVVEALSEIRALLRAQAAAEAQQQPPAAASELPSPPPPPRDLTAREAYIDLAALLAVSSSSKAGTFDPAEWSLSGADQTRLARVFARYEEKSGGGSGGGATTLNAAQIRSLSEEAGAPLSDKEARLAVTFLDENGDGTVDFGEFVSFVMATRAVRLPPKGGAGATTPQPPQPPAA